MGSIHVVTLEILRHGPPHNQLLSPLTNYLALCGNHPAISVQIPFEHSQLKLRLRPMSYQDSTPTLQLQLDDIAAALCNILGTIPGLVADAVNQTRGAKQLIHLRLILSASELALLPFELTRAPNGFPGAGQHLLLQSTMPICLTRETRRVKKDKLLWPTRAPKILVVAAQPQGVGAIPLESHLLVLRQAVEPWIDHYDESDPKSFDAAIRKHLVVLPRAGVDQIAKICKEQQFTHVHILAHGVSYQQGESPRYGLALHDSHDPAGMDVVDGERLANVLSDNTRDFDGSGPAVVTLATCNSGNVGSVEGVGASVAHALHEAGIPMIVASQFPLSFDGSVLMTQVLYEDLLWGKDPRPVLCRLRRQLQARVPHSHDWASVVAYASLPEDFDNQLPWVQLGIARESINAAMRQADEALNSERLCAELLGKSREKIECAKRRVYALMPCSKDTVAEVEGLLASTEKRQAQICFRQHPKELDPVRAHLKKACEHYWQALLGDRSSSWALVQFLALKGALEGIYAIPVDIWFSAKALASHDLESNDSKILTWAHGSLMELYLMASAMPAMRHFLTGDECAHLARHHAKRIQLTGVRKEIYTTWRQLMRYYDFFPQLDPSTCPWPWPNALIEELTKIFPEQTYSFAD